MSTFDGIIREIPYIRVDNFGSTRGESLFFLSHLHQDHMKGLEMNKTSLTPIYCSDVTARALPVVHAGRYSHWRRNLKPLATFESVQISLPNADSLTVTLLPANHCAGSCMFLFEYQSSRVLYTGDLRSDAALIHDLTKTTDAFSSTFGSNKRIDTLYMDTTFCDPRLANFPSKQQSIQALLSAISKRPKTTRFSFQFLSLGHEEIIAALSRTFDTQIHVSKEQYELYKSFSTLESLTPPDIDMMPFINCSTDDFSKARFHMRCDCWKRDSAMVRVKATSMGPLVMVPNRQSNNLRIRMGAAFTETAFGSSDESMLICENAALFIHVFYSMHSSYMELRNLVSVLEPASVHACVLDPSSMFNNAHTLTAFDDLLTPNRAATLSRVQSNLKNDGASKLPRSRSVAEMLLEELNAGQADSGSIEKLEVLTQSLDEGNDALNGEVFEEEDTLPLSDSKPSTLPLESDSEAAEQQNGNETKCSAAHVSQSVTDSFSRPPYRGGDHCTTETGMELISNSNEEILCSIPSTSSAASLGHEVSNNPSKQECNTSNSLDTETTSPFSSPIFTASTPEFHSPILNDRSQLFAAKCNNDKNTSCLGKQPTAIAKRDETILVASSKYDGSDDDFIESSQPAHSDVEGSAKDFTSPASSLIFKLPSSALSRVRNSIESTPIQISDSVEHVESSTSSVGYHCSTSLNMTFDSDSIHHVNESEDFLDKGLQLCSFDPEGGATSCQPLSQNSSTQCHCDRWQDSDEIAANSVPNSPLMRHQAASENPSPLASPIFQAPVRLKKNPLSNISNTSTSGQTSCVEVIDLTVSDSEPEKSAAIVISDSPAKAPAAPPQVVEKSRVPVASLKRKRSSCSSTASNRISKPRKTGSKGVDEEDNWLSTLSRSRGHSFLEGVHGNASKGGLNVSNDMVKDMQTLVEAGGMFVLSCTNPFKREESGSL
ncbi:beta-lactamase-like protein [Chytriomyces cf. hyalinus JEL632]|nr:beta-lactamase-like protein [Chytriomyces cf. hyalinus JEL632]